MQTEQTIGKRQGQGEQGGNLYSTQPRPDQNTDATVALMMAIGRAIVEDERAKGLEGFFSNPIVG